MERVAGNPNQYLSSAWINSKVEKFAKMASQAAVAAVESENLKKQISDCNNNYPFPTKPVADSFMNPYQQEADEELMITELKKKQAAQEFRLHLEAQSQGEQQHTQPSPHVTSLSSQPVSQRGVLSQKDLQGPSINSLRDHHQQLK